jgi:hypothetical protein
VIKLVKEEKILRSFLKQNPAIADEIESIIRAKSSDLADEILEEKIDEQIEDVPEVEEKE